MNLKRRAALTVALWGATTALTLTGAPAADAGGRPGCTRNPDNPTNPQTCNAGVGRPATKRGPIDLSDAVGPRVASQPPMCSNPNTPDVEVPVQVEDWGTGPDWPDPDFDPGAPPRPGARYYVHYCPGLNGAMNPNNWQPGSGWDNDTPAAAPPTPAQVRDALWAEVQALLVNPALALDPAQGEHLVLNIPTFVTINNPQFSTTYTATVQGVSVWIATIPTATLNPGEPGAPAIPCDEDGTAYVPGAGSVEAQADAADGCVYTYERKSAGWPGNVTITWQVPWGSNQAGENGTLDAAPNVGGFVRIVDEGQTVVDAPTGTDT